MEDSFCIVIDARSIGKKPSGIGMYAYGFIKALMNRHRNLQISLLTDVCESEQMLELKNLGAAVFAYDTTVKKSIKIFGYHRFVSQKLIQLKPDIFWEPNMIIPPFMKQSACKTIISVHDMVTEEMPFCYGLLYHWYVRYGLRYSLKKADLILYNSNETKIKTEKYFSQAAKTPGYVGYIICDTEKQDFNKKSDSEAGCFLYVGNMEYRKGVDLLISAYEMYCKSGGTRELILAGRITDANVGRRIKRAVQKNSTLKYADYVSQQDKHRLYSGCAAFVFPSRLEGFGIPVVEAVMHNKPVIIGDNSIYDEVLYKNCCVEKNSLSGIISCQMTGKNKRKQTEALFASLVLFDELESTGLIKKDSFVYPEEYTEKLCHCYGSSNLEKNLYERIIKLLKSEETYEL